MKNLRIQLDTQGLPIYGRPISTDTRIRNCQAGVVYQHDIPEDADVCILSGTHNYFVSYQNISLPILGQQKGGQNLSLNPEMINDLAGNDTLYIVSQDDGFVTMEFYKVIG